MAIKKLEFQREFFDDNGGNERQLFGCPLTLLDDFAACMTLFNKHITESDDEANIQQLYEGNAHFKEVTDKALTMCGINLPTINHNHIADLLHSWMDEKEAAFYPGRLVQINFPFSKKYRFAPLEDMERELYPDLVDIVEELTDAVELIEEIEKANGSSSNDV